MTLIPCYECGAEISNQTESCPQCGASRVPPQIKELLAEKKKITRNNWIILFVILTLYFIISVIIGQRMVGSDGQFMLITLVILLSYINHRRWKEKTKFIYTIFDDLRNKNEWK